MRALVLLLSALFVLLVTRGNWWAPLPFFVLPGAWYALHRAFGEKLRSSLGFFWAVILFELSPLLLLKPVFAFQQGAAIPVGLSFFVFQAVAFTADWRKKKISALPGFADYWLYLIFFPKFLCGPLERFDGFSRQQIRFFPIEKLASAFELILWGLVKKFLVANYLRSHTSAYFDRGGPPSSLLEVFTVTYVFAVEFYCDFSAYTDLARGVSLLFGVELSANFKQPYLARNPQDFWQRWHISLSHWFRDYVHFPLFFSTKNLYFTVFATFFLMGIWHGLGMNYIFLGIYWGAVMAGYSFLQPFRVNFFAAQGQKKWFPFFSWFLTFHVVVASFFLLRAVSPLVWSKISLLEPWRLTPFVEQSFLRILFCLPLLICVETVRQQKNGLSGLSLAKKIGFVLLLAYYSFILFYFTEEKGLTDVRFLYFQF